VKSTYFLFFAYPLIGDEMKIIAHKNNLYNTEEFIQSVLGEERISGLALDITITKDNQIIIFNWVSTNDVTIKNVQNMDLSSLQKGSVLLLEDMLEAFKDTHKKVIINFCPLLTEKISDDNIEQINEKYQNYVKVTLEILKKYAYMDLYLSSIHEKVIYFLKQMATFARVGYVLYEGAFNYIDTDYYVFTTGTLDEKICTQQLDIGKEIMIAIQTNDDLNAVWNAFQSKNEKSSLKRIFDETYFINDYPDLFYQLFEPLES